MVFLVRERGSENIEKRGKETEEKHWKMKRKKNEEYKESQITTINVFGFTFYIKKYILLESIVWKKVVYVITFYLHILFVGWYLKPRNDTPKLNMHKYTNYNILETYMKRLSNTKQIFMAMDYLILMSEKYLHFIKKTKACGKETFSHPVKVTGSMCVGNILKIICISKICTKPWKKFN